jgi:spore coat polysaccharide biosynthesis predicted glycosyltransferase SpsG
MDEKDFTPVPEQDVLIIDSYTLNPECEFLERSKWLKKIALVDIGTPNYEADLYIHCGTNRTIEYLYSQNNSKFVGGIEFTTIRKSLKNLKYSSTRSDALQPIRILVVGGATDPTGFVKSIARELSKLDEQFEAALICDEIKSIKEFDSRFTNVIAGPALESQLERVDLIFTLAGTSSWDFLSCGFPIGISLGFENQRDNYEYQLSNALALDIGHRGIDGEFEINLQNMRQLISNDQLRLSLSMNATKTVDKFGAKRVKDEIVKISFKE